MNFVDNSQVISFYGQTIKNGEKKNFGFLAVG